MPKHNKESTHFFINQALTSKEVNLSVYADEDSKTNLRLVAIDAILSILHSIESKHVHSKLHHKSFELKDEINIIDANTGLGLLDYCMVGGFSEIAKEIMQYGATSKNLDVFESNIRHSFSDDGEQPDILKDIRTIISGCIEIKGNYDQFVNTTRGVLPKIVAATRDIGQAIGTPGLIIIGIGSVILAPIVHPVVHGTGTVMIASAGLLPILAAFFAGGTPDKHKPSEIKQDSREIIRNLLHLANRTKQDLLEQAAIATAELNSPIHPAVLAAPVSQLHHLANIKAKQKLSHQPTSLASAITLRKVAG